MKLKSISLVTLLLSSVYLISCVTNVTTTTNPTPTATATTAPAVQTTFTGTLTGTATKATGTATLVMNADQKTGVLNVSFQDLSSDEIAAHIHGPAAVGATADPILTLPIGQIKDFAVTLTAEQFGFLNDGKLYVNVHTKTNPNGEIRAQLTKK